MSMSSRVGAAVRMTRRGVAGSAGPAERLSVGLPVDVSADAPVDAPADVRVHVPGGGPLGQDVSPDPVPARIPSPPSPLRRRGGPRDPGARWSTTARGLVLAVISCLAFGMSGTLAKGLMETGWSPLATVGVRVSGAALLLGLPALWVMRRRLSVLRAHAGLIVGYGMLAVAATQLCYFLAVQTLPVAVALLVEYLGPVMVVGWLWLRHGQRPGLLTGLGALLAMTGLALVLGVTGRVSFDLVGVAWALGAATGLAGYFLLSARPTPDLPPLVLVGCGMLLAAVVLGLIGATGLLPVTGSNAQVELGPWLVSPVVPLALLILVSAVLAYTTGLLAARALGSRVASFVSLLEVLAAVGFAWMLLGEVPGALQAAGGVLVVLGAIAVKAGEPQ